MRGEDLGIRLVMDDVKTQTRTNHDLVKVRSSGVVCTVRFALNSGLGCRSMAITGRTKHTKEQARVSATSYFEFSRL